MAGEKLSFHAFRDPRQMQREPAWLARLREQALERYRTLGLPSTRHEDWKYTNLSAVGPIEASASPAAATAAVRPMEIDSAARLVFVDGRLDRDRSALSSLPAGLELRSVSDSIEQVEQWISRYPLDREDGSKALNTAYFSDGAWMNVARGARIEKPIHVVHVTTSGRAAFSRNLIRLEPLSQATIVEEFLAPEGGADSRLTSVITQMLLGQGAKATHVRFQQELGAIHLSDLFASQSADSTLESFWISLGAVIARNEVHAVLSEPNSEARLIGLYGATGREQVDGHTVIDHASPHCRSEEVYKGIMADQSRGAFTGRIVVRKDAQKTDSRQINRNLLLSENAVADTRPQLQIEADDVKCSHGATIGRLDEEQLYYLRSRGIGVELARKLVSRAFGGEVLDRLPEELRAAAGERFDAWLAGGKA
ncbi:MAG TPA: Fe-S cluster assembly protein SufD [Bdellovibrionota bacterium]|nr:Fe-S cluster assembly protein SufD [Bdellovibrionota bacterium]